MLYRNALLEKKHILAIFSKEHVPVLEVKGK